MKHSTVVIIVLVLIVLMVKSPKKTTSQITTGENAAAKLASAVGEGLFGGSTKASH